MATKEEASFRSLLVHSAVLSRPQNSTLQAARRANSYHISTGTGESKSSKDLRQTALRNGLTRAESTPRISLSTEIVQRGYVAPKNRNIPMVGAPAFIQTANSGWGTYTLHQSAANNQVPSKNSGVENARNTQKGSISPLTQVRRSSEISVLLRHMEPAESHNQKLPESLQSSVSRVASASSLRGKAPAEKTRGRNRDGRSNHNSMFSLAPMTRSESEPETSDDEYTRYLEAEKIESPGDPNITQNELYEDSYLQIPGLANASSVLDLMTNSAEPQDDASRSKNENTPSTLDNASLTTRTSQKVLDMKLLRSRQEEISTSAMGASGLGNLQEYAYKIQHESIVSQWTQIRLRFSTRPEKKKESNPTFHAGILGSIERARARSAQVSTERRALDATMTWKNVHTYLNDIWNDPSLETPVESELFESECKAEEVQTVF